MRGIGARICFPVEKHRGRSRSGHGQRPWGPISFVAGRRSLRRRCLAFFSPVVAVADRYRLREYVPGEPAAQHESGAGFEARRTVFTVLGPLRLLWTSLRHGTSGLIVQEISSTSFRIMGTMRSIARDLWLSVFFISSGISAMVTPSSGTMKIGS